MQELSAATGGFPSVRTWIGKTRLVVKFSGSEHAWDTRENALGHPQNDIFWLLSYYLSI